MRHMVRRKSIFTAFEHCSASFAPTDKGQRPVPRPATPPERTIATPRGTARSRPNSAKLRTHLRPRAGMMGFGTRDDMPAARLHAPTPIPKRSISGRQLTRPVPRPCKTPLKKSTVYHLSGRNSAKPCIRRRPCRLKRCHSLRPTRSAEGVGGAPFDPRMACDADGPDGGGLCRRGPRKPCQSKLPPRRHFYCGKGTRSGAHLPHQARLRASAKVTRRHLQSATGNQRPIGNTTSALRMRTARKLSVLMLGIFGPRDPRRPEKLTQIIPNVRSNKRPVPPHFLVAVKDGQHTRQSSTPDVAPKRITNVSA